MHYHHIEEEKKSYIYLFMERQLYDGPKASVLSNQQKMEKGKELGKERTTLKSSETGSK